MRKISLRRDHHGARSRNSASASAKAAVFSLLLVIQAHAASAPLPPLDPQAVMGRVMSNPEQARTALLAYSEPDAVVRPEDAMLALGMIARSYEMQGKYEQAISYAERHFALAEKRRDLRNMAQAMNDIGAYNRPLGNLEVAVRDLKQAANLASQAKDANLWGQALFNLSVLMLNFGDYENALVNSLESQKVMEKYGGRPYPASGFGARANIYFRLGRFPEALSALDAAQKNLDRGDNIGALELAGMRSLIYEKLGKDQLASQFASQCLQMTAAVQMEPRETYACQLVLSAVAIKSGDKQTARQHLETARQILQSTPDSTGAGKLLLERDYHARLFELARLEGKASDVAAESAVLSELDRKISSARESSQAATVAAQIKIEGKDLSIALLEARNANLRTEARERLAWISAGITFVLAILGGLFLWYRARQLRLRQEQRHIERTRIARDLHDTLLQNMAGTQLQLQAAAMQASRDKSPLTQRLEMMVSQLGESMASARDAVWQMRSAMIERGALDEAIAEWVEQTCGGSAAKVQFEADGAIGKLSPAQAEDLLRIVQEAVGNAMRHAGARLIAIRLARRGGVVELSVSDDGQGFDLKPDSAGYGGHWGLVGMRERAERLGAVIAIESSPGAGTRIAITLPG